MHNWLVIFIYFIVLGTTTNEPIDIMERLEQAINSGNHKEAALLAKEVSKLQISTKLSLKELSEKRNNKKVEKIRFVGLAYIFFQ